MGGTKLPLLYSVSSWYIDLTAAICLDQKLMFMKISEFLLLCKMMSQT